MIIQNNKVEDDKQWRFEKICDSYKWANKMFPSSHDILPENLDESLIVLEKMLSAGNNILITSKPRMECIKAICEQFPEYKHQIQFMLTITAKDGKILSFWEPKAPAYKERMDCLRYAFEAGFRTLVSIEPMLDPDHIENLVKDLTPYVNGNIRKDRPGSIWIGRINYTSQIKGMHSDNKEVCQALDDLVTKTDEKIRDIYDLFKDNPLIEYKSDTLPKDLEQEYERKGEDILAKIKGVKRITKYALHPVASAFPEMPNSAFDELKRSIKENGLRHPIVLHEGKIVDGKNRYKACVELGIEPKTTKWDGKGLLTDFVCDMNINRRDLERNQRYAVALKLKQSYAKEAKENQRLSKGRGKKGSCLEHKPLDARKMACKKARVGEHSLAAVEELHEKARDLFDSVFEGGISLTGAMKSLKLRENPEYFGDVVGHFSIEWALPENTWVSDVRLDKGTQLVLMKVRHQSENGLKKEVLKQLENLPLKSYEFKALDDIEKHLMGQITTEEAKKKAKVKQALKKMEDNKVKFQGKEKQAAIMEHPSIGCEKAPELPS